MNDGILIMPWLIRYYLQPRKNQPHISIVISILIFDTGVRSTRTPVGILLGKRTFYSVWHVCEAAFLPTSLKPYYSNASTIVKALSGHRSALSRNVELVISLFLHQSDIYACPFAESRFPYIQLILCPMYFQLNGKQKYLNISSIEPGFPHGNMKAYSHFFLESEVKHGYTWGYIKYNESNNRCLLKLTKTRVRKSGYGDTWINR